MLISTTTTTTTTTTTITTARGGRTSDHGTVSLSLSLSLSLGDSGEEDVISGLLLVRDSFDLG